MSKADFGESESNHQPRNSAGSEEARHASRSDQAELAALLKLVGTLGITVCGGIAALFFAGFALDAHFQLGGIGTASGTVFGIAGSFYWAYHCIMKHLAVYSPETEKRDDCP